ncbi:acetyl-CoA hydrolase/transferase C-terminal domain-containing protein [Acidothermaceae bacterium B102]|nr:acetyl-CoA hydrolase/transferase C-terminal domain-containing protein [Acidothermaceae bacterium B102]
MSGRPESVSAKQALLEVSSGMLVAAGGLSAEPIVLLEALGQRATAVERVTLLSGMFVNGYRALSPHLGNAIRLETWFMPQTLLGDVGMGPNVDFLPMSWTQVCRYVERLDVDVSLVMVSPRDENGYYSLGISSSLNSFLVRRSKVVIAQVNDQMPFTLGDSLVHESDIDYIVHHSSALPPYPHRPPNALDTVIGRYVADLIPDGAMLQFGVGTIPEAVARSLATQGRSRLRITGMLTDAGRALVESGCCVSDRPAVVVGEVCGSPELYRWVNRNPAVLAQDGLHTHSLRALAEYPIFASVNSTLDVDLFGQVNSEVLRHGQAGGIGGSVDFMMGAQLNDENMAIVALPSTTSRGASRIVPTISKGLVTAPRTLVQYVVTEFGVADLRFLSASRRAEAIAGISHPDHRDELLAAGKELTRIG